MGIILDDAFKKNVLLEKRRSDRAMWIKIDFEGEMVKIMSIYAPQTGCEEAEKAVFWEQVNGELADIPRQEELWIGRDFNGHVRSDNTGKEDVIGKYGFGTRNEEGETLIDFALSMDLAISNTYFKKAERQLIYRSGRVKTQIDYILCQKTSRGTIRDCKVILGESVATQHRPVVCTARPVIV